MPLLLRLLALLLLCLGSAAGAVGAVVGVGAAPELVLHGQKDRVDAFGAATMLSDPSHRLQLADVLARRSEFVPPASPSGNLGRRDDSVWLLLPVRVREGGRWFFEIEYPTLNRADFHLLEGGVVVMQRRLGNDQPFSARPIPARTHAVELDLRAGARYELLLRVRSQSSMVVPLGFYRGDGFWRHEARGQIVQGLMLGVMVALLAYSLSNGLSLRDPLFAYYSLILLGMAVFFTAFSGIGQQHLWERHTGLMLLIAPLSVAVSIVASGPFFANALGLAHEHRWMTRLLYAVSAAGAVVIVLALTGASSYGFTQTAVTMLGPLPMLLALRPALIQARRGSATARSLLVGWSASLVGALGIAALLRGWISANFWTQQLFQFAMTIEMLVWVRVLSLRVRALRDAAELAERDRLHLRALAYTDPLTGLLNRRGLLDALTRALAPEAMPADGPPAATRLLALYMLDLDGFKAVNDRLGHEAGDELLVEVAQRLQRCLRAGDVVARLGGDEFVVLAESIRDEGDAQELGCGLLAAVATPIVVRGQDCEVGITIGYALAPLDGNEASLLLSQADAAMYAGKQDGRRCLRRHGRGESESVRALPAVPQREPRSPAQLQES